MPFTQTAFKQTLCSDIAGFSLHLLKMMMRRPWPAQNTNGSVKMAVGNIARAFLFAGGLIIVLGTWGLDPATLAASGTAGRTMQTTISVFLTAIIGWATWDFLRTIINGRSLTATKHAWWFRWCARPYCHGIDPPWVPG